MTKKNYKSIIHNFAHSLQSYDFTHSEIVVFDLIVESYLNSGSSEITFDFIDEKIFPKELNNLKSQKLLNDYLIWLPQLITSQNSNPKILEKLSIKVEIDFNNFTFPINMSDCVEIELNTKAIYKVTNEKDREINISQKDIYGKKIMSEKLIDFIWTS